MQGSLTRREYATELTFKVVESDKRKIIAEHNKSLGEPNSTFEEPGSASPMQLPSLRFGTSEDPLPSECTLHEDLPMTLEPGWHTIRTGLFFVYAGKLPFVTKEVKMVRLDKGRHLPWHLPLSELSVLLLSVPTGSRRRIN